MPASHDVVREVRADGHVPGAPVIEREDFVGQVNGAFRATRYRLGSIARLDLPSALRSALTSRMSAAPFESEPAVAASRTFLPP